MPCGGTGGIGAAIVKAYLAEGAKVAFSSTSQTKIDALIPTLNAAPGQDGFCLLDSPGRAKRDNVPPGRPYGQPPESCRPYPAQSIPDKRQKGK